jgi:hypothetical protein
MRESNGEAAGASWEGDASASYRHCGGRSGADLKLIAGWQVIPGPRVTSHRRRRRRRRRRLQLDGHTSPAMTSDRRRSSAARTILTITQITWRVHRLSPRTGTRPDIGASASGDDERNTAAETSNLRRSTAHWRRAVGGRFRFKPGLPYRRGRP